MVEQYMPPIINKCHMYDLHMLNLTVRKLRLSSGHLILSARH